MNYRQAVNDGFIRAFEISAVGGVGLTAPGIGGRPIGIELRAERSGGFVSSTLYKAPINRFSALLSLNLF